MTIYERRHNFTDPLNMWDNRISFTIDLVNVTNAVLPVILDKRAGRLTARAIYTTNYFFAETEELKLIPCNFENMEEFEVPDREAIIAGVSRAGTILCIEEARTLELAGV